MKELLEKFENKRPEVVFEWKDSETEAEGWVVINSLRGGAAGGGTRMRPGLDKREVESLAKTMEVKFTVSGPEIGGAKSGINFDPNDPRKKGVLERWYKAVFPLLKNYYGTGGDLNVDEIHEVIPITEEYGLWHPQEGVVNGHYNATEPEKIKKLGQLRQGVIKVIEAPTYSPDVRRKYTVADMVTGFGVAKSVEHYYHIWGGKLHKKRAIIQGWGNVGASAAFFLAQAGVNIVGIIDRNGGLINENGFSLEEITHLFLNRKGNELTADNLIPFDEINEKIWALEAEVFIPAAASRLITKQHVEEMIDSKLEVIAAGANVPFADKEIFFGPIADYADSRVAVVPDFIANCGMARVFAYLMTTNAEITDEAIFEDTSRTIERALRKTFEASNSKVSISKTSFEIALSQLI
ncbi:Glutamate dehydrogenase/leucine dehydrogenase [Marivirga sericea]|uniref:Glutamate dehydrogenase/leucine dehydrogenase n=1 Tax=Marivirga sericea TaxID=1028 RepID=A0A1X7KQ81_9BACT|nr:Glu/Leu/Phe/Val dehydrogenase dimerization domain-containing protein [Marivirga sericea]SMG43284.1 Glutamate dehydrogenase/leucine dehydrogenase [Marivirga sericea]